MPEESRSVSLEGGIALKEEIADLERRLQNARNRLNATTDNNTNNTTTTNTTTNNNNNNANTPNNTPTLHSLLLLSDSALPLGSFAYSNGLESFLAHNKPHTRSITPIASFHRFLRLSIASVASTTLPYVLAAFRFPRWLGELDNDLDASTPCVVSQRASLAQGRALLGVWERSFRGYAGGVGGAAGGLGSGGDGDGDGDGDGGTEVAIQAIENFSDALKLCFDDTSGLGPKGHFAPLWGVVCLAMGLDLRQTAYVFMVNHAKAVLSAAVRASVLGPYQAQNVLASRSLQDMIADRIQREWKTEVENAGQTVPIIDLWVGRHELLYSRIFNS